MKRVISYNLNGIRSAVSKGLDGWLKAADPDIVCFQETKAQPDQIPVELFEAMGYHHYWFSAVKKGYSGVGILSKIKPDHVDFGMNIQQYDDEGRTIMAHYGGFTVISVYHPSGTTGEVRQGFKMTWLEDFLVFANELRKTRPSLIICGDFNICHQPIDIHDPIRNATSSGFLPEEREWLTRFFDSGFIDTFRVFNQEPRNYTWWSFRAGARSKNLGWRIDYQVVTPPLEKKLLRAAILPEARHSDHCPTLLEIDF
jgi:exodeoxyribonuclease-3